MIPFLQFASHFYIPIPVTVLFVVVFTVQLIANMVVTNEEYLDGVRFLYMFLFLWIAVAHLFNTFRLSFSFDEFRLLLGRVSFAVIVLMTYYITRVLQDYTKILRIFCYSVVFLSGLIIFFALFHLDPFGVMTKHPREYWGISMPFNKTSAVPMSYGEFAIIVISAIPVLVYSAVKKLNIFSSTFSIFATSLIFGAIFITQSRNSWLSTSVTISALFFLYIKRRSLSFMKVNAILIVFSAIAMSIIIFNDIIIKFINGFIGTGIYRDNVFNRLESFIIGIKLFLHNIFVGVGNSNIENYTRFLHHRFQEIVLHNTFIDQLAGTGLFGFIPFLLLFIIALYQLLKISRSKNNQIAIYGRILLASFLGNLCALQFYRGFFSETLAVEFGLVMSLWDFYQKDIITAHNNLENVTKSNTFKLRTEVKNENV
jgi:O-antigen ligase